MGKVYVIRHGQSEWNLQKRWAGGTADIELTDQGRQQARAACLELRQYGFQAISSSPLRRSRETAAIIASEITSPLLDPIQDFNERDFGELSGLTTEEIKEKYPEFLACWRDGKPSVVPGGEPWDSFIKRIIRGVNALVEQPGDFLIIAHMGVLRAIEFLKGEAQSRHDNLKGIWVRHKLSL